MKINENRRWRQDYAEECGKHVICDRQNEKLIDRSIDLSFFLFLRRESRKIVDSVENAWRNAINEWDLRVTKLKINQPHNVDRSPFPPWKSTRIVENVVNSDSRSSKWKFNRPSLRRSLPFSSRSSVKINENDVDGVEKERGKQRFVAIETKN